MPSASIDRLMSEAVAHHRGGRLAQAEALYRQVLAARRNHPEALHLLGLAAYQGGRLDEAAALIAKAVARGADRAEVHYNLGNVHRLQGRLEQAAKAYGRALALDPRMADAWLNRGVVMRALGRNDAALADYRRAAALRPGDVKALHNLGSLLAAMGQADEAAEMLRKVAAVQPSAPLLHGLANLDLGRGRFDLAEASLRQAAGLDPASAAIRTGLGLALAGLGRYDEAIACHREAIARDPALADAHNNLGNALKEAGQPEAAADSYRQAIAIEPGFAIAHSNLLVTLPFLPLAPETVAAEYRRFGDIHEAPLLGCRRPHGNDRAAGRRLRIGYLSPQLRDHILVQNLEPVLRGHHRDRVAVHVYAHVPNPDRVTERLRGHADAWTFIHGMDDDAVAERIRADGIDILVHTMGHWADNRIMVLARKPAPVQAAYLCQSPSSGLQAVDYLIADPLLDEGGAVARLCREQVVHLPGGFQVTEYAQAPAIAPPPCLERGAVTFASFNNRAKVSEASIALWAAVLHAVPGARLLVKSHATAQADPLAGWAERFAAHGIGRDRLAALGWVADYFAAFAEADIMLDTTPFAGGRTSEDALWMGVPVVGLAGATGYGRFTASLLRRAGHGELAADSPESFVAIAAALAADPARLAGYRTTLRAALKASPVMDFDRHVSELEDAYRWMWRRWLESG
jgi:predicted O-linked N-acetylglucosamine transferase (SPINDLY family)